MSLVSIIVLALAAAPLEPAPAAAPSSAAFDFDAQPAPPVVSDDVRVKRFLGAFAGGVVGLGLGLALVPLGDGGCFGFPGPCVNAGHTLLAGLAPLLAATGAWAGYQVLGGDGGWLTAASLLPPALLVSMGLVAVSAAQEADTPLAHMPYVATAGFLFAGTAAFALDQRSRQLERLGGAADWGRAGAGRVALASLVSMLSLVPTVPLVVLGAWLGQFSVLGPALVGTAVLGGLFGSAAAVWGTHRGLGGRGSYGSALLGLAIGAGLTLGGVLAVFATSGAGGVAFSPLRGTAIPLLFVELGALCGMFAAPVALELSHTAAVERALPRLSFGASPVNQGAMVGASMRF